MSEPKGHQQISYSSVALDLTFASEDSRLYCRECQIRHTSLACKNKKHASKSTTVTPETSGIPRAMVLTVSFVVSPESRALLPPSPVAIATGLIPASGYQDATTSPSATRAFVSCACCVHRISCPTFCDDRETPLMRAEDARKSAGDLPVVTSEKTRGTLARRANQVMSRKRRQDPSSLRAREV
jgi:hypothetical protein